MKRFYYISDNLSELEKIEHDLEESGIPRPHIYVLSNDDVGLESHDVNRVASFLKTDVIHSGEIGALVGLSIAALVLLGAYFSDVTAQVGWMPFVFLAIVVFGFSTWEGGFIGIQEPNTHFARFEKALAEGRHVLFVETGREEKKKLKKVIKRYPNVKRAGTEITHTGPFMLLLRSWEALRSRTLIFQGRPSKQQ